MVHCTWQVELLYPWLYLTILTPLPPPFNLPAHLLTPLSSNLPAHLLTPLPSNLPAHLLTPLPSNLPAHLLTGRLKRVWGVKERGDWLTHWPVSGRPGFSKLTVQSDKWYECNPGVCPTISSFSNLKRKQLMKKTFSIWV